MKNLLLCAVLAVSAASALAHERPAPTAPNPSWDKMKSLVGDWIGAKGEKIGYKLVSNGTALMESMSLPNGEDMITMYVPTKTGVSMTHYCAIGNQPRMTAKPGADANALAFKTVEVANKASADAPYMDSLTLTFAGPDALKADWTSKHGGKPSDHAVFDLKRAK